MGANPITITRHASRVRLAGQAKVADAKHATLGNSPIDCTSTALTARILRNLARTRAARKGFCVKRAHQGVSRTPSGRPVTHVPEVSTATSAAAKPATRVMSPISELVQSIAAAARLPEAECLAAMAWNASPARRAASPVRTTRAASLVAWSANTFSLRTERPASAVFPGMK